MEINTETLITLVQERPVLWDKTEDDYKDKHLKLAAWREVCLVLNPNFDELEEKERKQYGKLVSTKWNNVRDAWLKTMKKQKDESTSGSSAKKTRNYLYHDQLMFMKKVTDPRPPDESVPKRARIEPEEGTEENTQFRLPSSKDKRKSDKDINDKMIKFLDSRTNPETENHHLSFFKGIIPSLNTLNVDETLEFQAGVLALIQNIKKNHNRQNYGHRLSSMQGHNQHNSGYYTYHNNLHQQATPAQTRNVNEYGYSTQYNRSDQHATPSTSSQSYNTIPASPAASSVNSQDSDYLDFTDI